MLSTAAASRRAASGPLPFVASVASWSAAFASVVAGLLAGMGWLYLFRDLGWFAAGPRIGQSLPLLQLAGFDVQPLLRVVLAWLLAGALIGLVMLGVPPLRRALVVGAVALVLLLVGSQAAYSLTRNAPLSSVLLSHAPGPGPVLEAAALTLGCYVPRPRRTRSHEAASGDGQHGGVSGSFLSRALGLGERGLGSREHRDAGQDDRDRDHVGEHRPSV